MGKKWYQSKTVWTNLLAAGALIVQSQFGFVVSPEEQAGVLVVLNIILRAITTEPLQS